MILPSVDDDPAAAPQKGLPSQGVGRRDHDVLEIVVRDLLDPTNPEYELDAFSRARWPKQIVLDTRTQTRIETFSGEESLDHIANERRLPNELTKNWRCRNSRDSVPTALFKIKNKNVIFVNIDKLVEEDESRPFFLLFNDRFPNVVCYACPYLPGFTKDGLHSVVVLYVGPSPHGVVWVHYIEFSEHRWNIVWRYREVWE